MKEIRITATSCNDCEAVVGTVMGAICGLTGENVSSDIIKNRFNKQCQMEEVDNGN